MIYSDWLSSERKVEKELSIENIEYYIKKREETSAQILIKKYPKERFCVFVK